MLYVTPDRFRTMGFGIDLDGVEDVELLSILTRATHTVNRLCAAPMLPQQHDFRGGNITGELHRWRLGDINTLPHQGTRRVYPDHMPIQSLSSFKVQFTTKYEVIIDPDNVYLNPFEGWCEVVAVAAIVSGIYPIGINFGLYSPMAKIDYIYGYHLPVTDEMMSSVDGRSYRAMNQWWDVEEDVEVKVNDAIVTTGFTIDYDEGAIIFDSNLAATDFVAASYTHRLPSAIAEATGIIAVHYIGERELQAKGMEHLQQLKVGEVTITRTREPQSKSAIDYFDPEVEILLAPFTFITVR